MLPQVETPVGGEAVQRCEGRGGRLFLQLAALLIVFLAYAFPIYMALSAPLTSETRFFTIVFGLVAWVYCLAQAFVIGAVLNQARMRDTVQ